MTTIDADNRTMPAFRLLCIAATLLVCAGCGSRSDEASPQSSSSEWDQFSVFELGWAAATSDSVRVRFSQHVGSDSRIDLDADGDGQFEGSVLLVGGRAVALRGVERPARTPPVDVLDALALRLQFATRLLGRAFPSGPGAIEAESSRTLTVSDTVRVSTRSASGRLAGPFQLSSTAARTSANEVAFTLEIHYPGASNQAVRRALHGRWRGGDPQEKIPDSLSVNGWEVHFLGIQWSADSTRVQYGSGARAQFQTLGDVRSEIAK